MTVLCHFNFYTLIQMPSLGFKLCKFQVLLPYDSGLLPKRVGGENCFYIVYAVHVHVVGYVIIRSIIHCMA